MAEQKNRRLNSLFEGPKGIDIAHVLECPVCFGFILPPIYPCQMGHSVCSSCRRKVKACPICRSPYVNCRNLFLEELLEGCRISCKFNGTGCPVIGRGKEMVLHELKCDFRPIHCFECNLLVNYDEYLEHLHREKKVTLLTGSGFRTAFNLENAERISGVFILQENFVDGDEQHLWQSTWLNYSGHNFFLRMESHGSDWRIILSMFGKAEDAEKWHCEIHAFNSDKKISQSYAGPVSMIRETGQEVSIMGKCLSLCRSTVVTLLNPEKEIEVKLRIRLAPLDTPPPVHLPPASAERKCHALTGMPQEFYVREHGAEEPKEQFRDVVIPVMAVVSIPVDQSQGAQHQNINGAGDASSHNGNPSFGPIQDPNGYMLGTKLGRLKNVITTAPPQHAAPMKPKTEISLFNFGQNPIPDVGSTHPKSSPRTVPYRNQTPRCSSLFPSTQTETRDHAGAMQLPAPIGVEPTNYYSSILQPNQVIQYPRFVDPTNYVIYGGQPAPCPLPIHRGGPYPEDYGGSGDAPGEFGGGF